MLWTRRARKAPATRSTDTDLFAKIIVVVGFTKSSHLTYNRYLPCVVQYRGVFLFRPIHPQHQLEFAGRSWQPVGFLPGTRTILLDVQVSRTIWVWYEVLTSAEGVTIYWVCDEEEILVVHRQRPEAVHWW